MATPIQIVIEAVDRARGVIDQTIKDLEAMNAASAQSASASEAVASALGAEAAAQGALQGELRQTIALEERAQAVALGGAASAGLTGADAAALTARNAAALQAATITGAQSAALAQLALTLEAQAAALAAAVQAQAGFNAAQAAAPEAIGRVNRLLADRTDILNKLQDAQASAQAGDPSLRPSAITGAITGRVAGQLRGQEEEQTRLRAEIERTSASLEKQKAINTKVEPFLKEKRDAQEFFRKEIESTNLALERAGVTTRQTDQAQQDLNDSQEEAPGILGRVNTALQENQRLMRGIQLAGAAVIATWSFMVRGALGLGDSLESVAKRTGIAVEGLSTLKFAVEENDASFEDLQIGLRAFSRNVVEAASDPASQAGKAFSGLSVAVADTAGKLKGNEQLLKEVATGLLTLPEGAERSARAMELFGRSGEQLIPFLSQGATGIERLQEQARALGLEFSSETARQAAEFSKKMRELRIVLSAVALDIAQAVLPALRAFQELIIQNRAAVVPAFLAISAAIAGAGLAITALRTVALSSRVLAALVGVAEITNVREYISAIQLLTTNVIGYARAAASAVLAVPFGTYVVAIAAATAAIMIGVEAWKLYKAKKDEALAAQGLAEQNVDLKRRGEERIRQLETEGRITVEQATRARKVLEEAFKPDAQKTVVPGSGFGTGRALEVTENVRNIERESTAIREFQRLLREFNGIDPIRPAQIAAQPDANLKLIGAQIAADLQILRTTRTLEEAELNDFLEHQAITLEEFRTKRAAIATRTFEDERKLTEAANFITAELSDREIRERGVKEKLSTETVNRQITEARTLLKIKETEQLAGLEAKHIQELISLEQEFKGRSEANQRTAAAARITLAQETGERILAARLQVEQRFADLEQNLRKADSFTPEVAAQFEQARRLALLRAEKEITDQIAEANLNLAFARLQAEKAAIQSDPQLSAFEKKERLIALLERENELLDDQARLKAGIVTDDVSSDEKKIDAQNQLLRIEQQRIENQRLLREPNTRLPEFQQEVSGRFRTNEITGERELIAPFEALDRFLTGTLQTSFQGISDAITGIITGTRTWGQVALQVGNSIIAQTVQLVLEYTLFHQIRMLLDRVFHNTARTNILTTSAAGKTAQLSAASTAVGAGATTAAAYAPASAAANTATFGASSVIGLTLTLAAIAAIIGALAFKEGGVIKGPGGPKDDQILTSARAGSGVLTAAAVERYGGERFLETLERHRTTVQTVSALRAPATAGTGGPDGEVLIRVSNGEGILSPETVAFFGGKPFIDALNAGQIAPEVMARITARPTAVKPAGLAEGGEVGWGQGAGVRGQGSGVRGQGSASVHLPPVSCLLSPEFLLASFLPRFASGGVIQSVLATPTRVDMDTSRLRFPKFESGGIVNVGTTLNSTENFTTIEATGGLGGTAAPPVVNVAPTPVTMGILRDRTEFRRWLESSEGRAVIFDLVSGQKTELGMTT